MAPIAIDPPAAPASTAKSFARSIMMSGPCNSQAGRNNHHKRDGRQPFGYRPRQDRPWSTYLMLVLTVRSAESRATKRPPHQFDWLPPLIALTPAGLNTAV